MKLEGKGFSVSFDGKCNIQEIAFGDRVFEPSFKCTLYEINDEIATVSDRSENPINKELSMVLASKEVSGKLVVSSGREVRLHFEPESKDAVKNVGLVFFFPLETEFHIPESFNLGRRIDRNMPVGESYSTNIHFKFFLADLKNMWIRFLARERNEDFQSLHKTKIHISRHPEVFIVTFTWNGKDDAFISVFPSIDEAVRDYESWLEKELGIVKLRNDPNVPDWVHNVSLVLTVDMMRPNWEIAHDYSDVTNLAKDLREIGCPRDTLVYVPGYNGAYDSTYPNYRPHQDLGGSDKFREMIDSLHENGFRVMIHTNGWGLDPCHPNIDSLKKYVLKDEHGNYRGFQTGGRFYAQIAPPQKPLKFRTEEISFSSSKGAKCFAFKTVSVPDECEAFFTIGGLKVEDARVRFTVDKRSLLTPPGWFRDHNEYAFPIGFPMLLRPGRNEVHVEVMGEVEPDWSESWYKIRYCYIPLNPYTSWSYPILFADTSDPEWISIFVDEVTSVVKEYGIDAVHIDATEYEWRKQLVTKLRDTLPNVAMAGEGFATLGGFGFWTFIQCARQSMLGGLEVMHGTSQQGALPDRSGLENLYDWLNKPSPVSNFVKDYIKVYPHLCASDAFVPIGKVCNHFPPRQSPRNKEELWKVLRDAGRLNYIPGLRVNYREYGLDEDTKRAIREIASR